MLSIKNIHIPIPTVFAPLAGITNLPLRLIAKEAGCGMVCSEMISSNGLVYDSGRTHMLMDSDPAEKPLSVQIFGSKPDIMAEAARIVADQGADIIDINFGCSVRKVLKTGSGSALMRTPDIAEDILKAVRNAVSIPLTIKIRSGWDASGDQALETAVRAEALGVDAIAVHPRTATQGFGGVADWSVIRRVKQALSIPVIGNGDIKTPDDAMRMFDETGCDGVMIGRAAMGNPWLFTQIKARIEGRPEPAFDLELHVTTMRRYFDESVAYLGDAVACRMMRSRLCWFVKGFPGACRFRDSIKHLETPEDGHALIDSYMDMVLNSERDIIPPLAPK